MKEVPPIRRDFLRITGSLAWVDFTGQTPFLTAALAGDVTVMKLLLKHGADPQIPTFGGTTALMAAAGVNWVFDQTYDEGQPRAARSGQAVCRARPGRQRRELDGADRGARRGQSRIGRHHPVPRREGRRSTSQDKEGRTPLTWAEGVFLATHPARPKPTSIALIKQLGSAAPVPDQKAAPPAKP